MNSTDSPVKSPEPGNSIALVWSALWRAEVSHLAIFAVLPMTSAILRAAVGIVLLPFLLVGFGDRTLTTGGEVAHLSQWSCWVALAPCSVTDRTLVLLPGTARSRVADDAPEPFLPPPSSLTLRHVWFVVWLAWFASYLIRRERRRRVRSES